MDGWICNFCILPVKCALRLWHFWQIWLLSHGVTNIVWDDEIEYFTWRKVGILVNDQFIFLLQVWSSILKHCSADSIVMAVCPWLGVWLCLLMQPMSLPFDNQLLIDAAHLPKVSYNLQSFVKPTYVYM